MQKTSIVWFRRDLRLHDNAALYHALKRGDPVIPLFIFDTNILDQLEEKADRRVEFIHDALLQMNRELLKLGSALQVRVGKPLDVFRQLLSELTIEAVYTNNDYERYARERDEAVRDILAQRGVAFHSFKDQVIFEKSEILKEDGRPYTVYTPYSRRWKALVNDFYLKSYPTEKHFSSFQPQPAAELPSLESLGFRPGNLPFPPADIDEELIRKYQQRRDFPSLDGTSRIGVHLRFGTISIRELARKTKELSTTFLDELIWREFYQMILWHFPHVGRYQAFRPEYDRIAWRNDPSEFKRWCDGQTGYPIVDAGMRELNATGFMHNRVRMVTASFLSKHLLIDWRWGEAYFAQKLLDYDFAANNGGWQWSAGSGCDAAPYFRIFNPTLQTQKFDPNRDYIRKWVPEFSEFSYPQPIVIHEEARKRCLEVYGKALKKELA